MPRQIQRKHCPYRTVVWGNADFTIGADAGTTINVAVQLKDDRNEAIAQVVELEAYLSDDASGIVLATASSGGWAIGTNGTLESITSGVRARIRTNASGQFDVTITEAGAHAARYLILRAPDGSLVKSGAITFV